MSGGRRRGETRRTRHDPLSKSGELDRRDANMVRALMDSARADAAARAFITEIVATVAEVAGSGLVPGGGMSRDAVEDLAHGLIRSALAPAELRRRLELTNQRRHHLIHRDVHDKNLSSVELGELKILEQDATVLVSLLARSRKLDV